MKKLWDKLTEGYADLMAIIFKPVQDGITWIMKLFGWDEAAAATEKFSIKTYIMGKFALIKEWFTGLFKWGEEAGKTEAGDWSLKKMVKDGLAKVWAAIKNLFSSLFDINWKSIMTSVVPDFIKNSVIGKAMGIADAPTAAKLAEDLAEAEGKLEQAQRIKGRAEKAASLGGMFAKGHQARAALQNDKIAELQKEIQEIKSQQAAAGVNVGVNAPNINAPTSTNLTVGETKLKGETSAAWAAAGSAW